MGRYVAISLLALTFLCFSCFTESPHFKYSEEANSRPSAHKLDSAHNHGHAYNHDHEHINKGVGEKRIPMSATQIWTDTICSVFVISIAPFLLLMIVPDLNKHRNLLKVLLGFAAGGLLGDAFLHLIPHALSPLHSHSHEHENHHVSEDEYSHSINSSEITVSLWVIGGICFFLCIDKFLRLLQPGFNGQSHDLLKQKNQANAVDLSSDGKKKNKKQNKNNNSDVKPSAQGDDKQHPQKSDSEKKKKSRSSIQTAGYLNLAADFTHNFTDGIAIAGSFMLSRNVGIVTTLTVLIHELPHEIGDYAILIQSGCGTYEAMFLQLMTALGALLGAACSLAASGVGFDPLNYGFPAQSILSHEFIATRLLPLTAGGFIYIALVSVMPDLLSVNSSQQPPASLMKRLGQSLAELGALILGVGLMVAITLFE